MRRLLSFSLLAPAAFVLISCGSSRSRLNIATAPLPARVRPAPPNESEHEDNAREAVEFFYQRRIPAGESKELLLQRYEAARPHVQGMRKFSIGQGRFLSSAETALDKTGSREATFGSWKQLGPGNIGGRTRNLVIHPTTPAIMYAGGVTGGVWKTSDGGTSWAPTSDFLPTITIGALILDPTATSTLYAGTGEWYTGEPGSGIYKTIDAGSTWTRLANASSTNFTYVNKLVLSPANSQRIYAATWTGVWASPDGGNTWTQTLNTKSAYAGCQDLAIRTDQKTDYLFASCTGASSTADYQIFRNINAASAGVWEMVQSAPNMGRTSIAIAPSLQSTIYAMATDYDVNSPYYNSLLAVFQSVQNGDAGTWTTKASSQSTPKLNTALLSYPESVTANLCTGGTPKFNGQGDYDNVLAVDPLDPDRVWAGGIDVFRSDDGGANWGLAMFWQTNPPAGAHADNHGIFFHPAYDGAANQTMFITNDGGVFRTDNARASVNTAPKAGCSPLTTGIKWISLNNEYDTTQFYSGAVFPSGTAYFGGTQDNGNLRGTDAGGPGKWTKLTAGDGGQVALDPVDASTMYYEYVNLALYKSTDAGSTYSLSTNGITEDGNDFNFITYYALDPNNSQRLYIGAKTLWRTEDGANSWSAASAPLANGQVIGTVAVAPGDSTHVLFSNGNGSIYRSTDALNTNSTTVWTSTRPRNGSVSAIAFDPTNINVAYAVYSTLKSASSDAHVYKTEDGGVTWLPMDGSGSTGIPDIPVDTVLVDPSNPWNVYLGTDMGVFLSTDGGYTWSHDDNPFANAITNTLVLDRGAGVTNLFAFTFGRGVWKVTLPNSGTPCTYAVSPNSIQVSAAPGVASFNVSTGAGCGWAVVPVSTNNFNSFAQPLAPANGVGSGPVLIAVTGNNVTTPNSEAFYIEGQRITVDQLGASVASGNDELIGAQAIGALPYGAVEDTRPFTSNHGDPVHSCTNSADFNTAWWQATAPSTGTMQVTGLGERYDVFGSSGVVLTAYPVSAGGVGKELACSVVARNTTDSTTGQIQFPVIQGTSYFIEASATIAGGGGYFFLSAAMITIPSITLTPPSPSLTAGQQQQFAANVTGSPYAAVRWTISPPVGNISTSGQYTAPGVVASAQSVRVTATSLANPAAQASATITINPSGIVFSAASTTNAATFHAGGVAPGEIVTIFGSGMGPANVIGPLLTPDNTKFTTIAGGAQVFFDGIAAPIYHAQSTQFSVMVPYEVAGKNSTQVQIKYNGQTSPSVTVPVTRSAPGLFATGGSGQAAALNQDGSVNSSMKPAPPGSVVVLYGTGEGQTNPPGVDGLLNSASYPLLTQSCTVTIGGINAQVQYCAEAPLLVSGVVQINVTVPASVKPSNSVPVVVTIGGVKSRSDVTIAVSQ